MTNTIENNSANLPAIGDNAPIDYFAQVSENAESLGVAIVKAEKTITNKAKAWGTAMLCAIKLGDETSDSLIGETKKAIGWNLLITPEGKKAKLRFNKWFSDLRYLLENWNDLQPETQTDLLDGKRAFSYIVEQLRIAERKAKKEAEKAAKAAENAENGDQPAGDQPAGDQPDAPAILTAKAIADIAGLIENAPI